MMHIESSKSNKNDAWVFDFDYTLFEPVAMVVSRNIDTGETKRLTQMEYVNWKYQGLDKTKEVLDFSEFKTPEFVLKSKPMNLLHDVKVLDMLIQIEKFATIYILSARRSVCEDAIFQILKEHNIETLERKNVITTGDIERWELDNLPKARTRHEIKREKLLEIKSKHTGLNFVDDEENNLKIAFDIPEINLYLSKDFPKRYK